jgi:predicted amidophosphoribosyltransferase
MMMSSFFTSIFSRGKENQKTRDADIQTLEAFIGVYCRNHHGSARGNLCEPCQQLLDYAIQRREKCPYDPKPACKNCQTHCYKPAYRQQIKAIMKYSGIYFIKRGRVDWMVKYFLLK